MSELLGLKTELLRTMPYLAMLVPLALTALIAAGVRVWGKAAPWISLIGPLVAVGVGAACKGLVRRVRVDIVRLERPAARLED